MIFNKKIKMALVISLILANNSLYADDIFYKNNANFKQRVKRDFRNDIPQTAKTQVWKKNNFLEMRLALEDLTNTIVNEQAPYGILYTTYNPDPNTWEWENPNNENINYYWGVGNKYMKEWLQNPDNKSSVADIAAISFNDVKGTEWYASYIPCAVYFGVINGYPDGTFRGNESVTRAEFAAMFDKAERQLWDKEYIDREGGLSAHENEWYYMNILGISRGPIPPQALTVKDMNSYMTRGEVARVLVGEFYNDDYVDYPDINLIKFKDIKTVGESIGGCDTKADMRVQYMKALKTPQCCPVDVTISLNVLKEKGIMQGDYNGNSNWNKPITRAEIIALLERIAHHTIP